MLIEISLSWWSTQKHDSKHSLSWKLFELNSRSKVRICHLWVITSSCILIVVRRDFSTSRFFSFNCLCTSASSLRFFSLYSSSWFWSSRVDVLETSTISDIWEKSTYHFFLKIVLTKGSIMLNTPKVFSPASVFSSVFSNRKFIKYVPKQINFYAEVWKHKPLKLFSNSMCSNTILFLSVSSFSSWTT